MRTPLILLALVTAAVFAATYVSDPSKAQTSTVDGQKGYENYDIRNDSSAGERLRQMRGDVLRRPSTGAGARFKIEYNETTQIAEIITPADGSSLTGSRAERAQVLRDFVSAHRDIFGPIAADQLHVTADYSNPDGNLAFAHIAQRIGGIPVFGAEAKAGFTRNNEMFRIINSLAPQINAASSDFGTPANAVVNAARHIGVEIERSELNAIKSDEERFSTTVFTDDVTAERFYFPIGNGVARPAWRVLLWTNESAYYVIVDTDGTLLWRKDIVEHQANAATYNIYGNSTSLLKTADSPSPFSPGCLGPTGCAQPSAIARTNFTLIGNEAQYTFNNLGWIPDTGLPVRTPADPNITDGNNVEAGIDRVAPNGVDENGWAVGNPPRVFSYVYNPAPGTPPPGEEPLPPAPQPTPPTAFQQGVIAHGFYTLNRWHDEMYRLGFTEQAGNFQHFNFGRGGAEGDRVSYEIQDSSGTNSGSASVTPDGTRPRLVMMIFTGSTPDRDGALDAHVVLHEITHVLAGRLHGNTTGLGSNMARGMTEGWADFYAFALLSEPADDPLGTHALGAYAIYQLTPGFESNYYHGLRRFPVALWGSRGPNGLPHNPLTLRYINNNCNALIGTTMTNPNSAFPRGPVGVNTCDQAHNMGEVWAVTLWEVRDQLIQRHGAAEGNRRALQYVTDGMKLSPLNPTMLNSRDAIITAASISDPADAAPVWRGFAIRGLGFSASIQNAGTGNNNTVVTESFDLPVQFRRPTRADFDGDGKTDISVFRPSDKIWYMNRSTAGFAAYNFGLATDTPLPDDFDGDGKSDVAVFRATADGSLPDYYILQSLTSTVSFISWGTTDDVPVTEDFDGDNKADQAIYRPSSGIFWIRRSTDGGVQTVGPIFDGSPLSGDFDGDGRGDVGMFDSGTWRLLRSSNGYASSPHIFWGTIGDRAVHGDYDGDGRDDLAVYRPSTGLWYIINSSGGARIESFGLSTDIPAPADYDGDGRTDIAVYRNGVWYLNRSTSGFAVFNFGLAGDKPLPASFSP